jgi:hypothetical protein
MDKIRKFVRDFLNEGNGISCPLIQLTNEIVDEVNKFSSSEDLLRSGGISIENLDRAAFGFSSGDIKKLEPKQLSIKWKDDLENVKFEIQHEFKKSGLGSFKDFLLKWAQNVSLETPIDVSYEKNKFFIEDGHHRYFAAKILKKPLNVNLEIKMNPITKLAPKLSYDDFHRCVFKQVKNI